MARKFKFGEISNNKKIIIGLIAVAVIYCLYLKKRNSTPTSNFGQTKAQLRDRLQGLIKGRRKIIPNQYVEPQNQMGAYTKDVTQVKSTNDYRTMGALPFNDYKALDVLKSNDFPSVNQT